MQEHPVPQNVTQFEFHLVGDMTLKQFGYVGAGLGIAYLIFTSLAPKLPYVAYPAMVISAMIGVALAFLPFQDRPLDHWLKAYFRAIFAPTKATYQSKILKTDEDAYKKRLKLYLHETVVNTPIDLPNTAVFAQQAPATQIVTPVIDTSLGDKAAGFVESVVSSSPQPAKPVEPVLAPKTNTTPVPAPEQQKANTTPVVSPPPTHSTNSPSQPDLDKVVKYAEEAQILQTEIVSTEKELEAIKHKAANPNQDPKQVALEFQKVLKRLETFNSQARVISDELNRMTNTGSGVEVMQPQSINIPTVKINADKLEKYSSLTTFENILNGIVYDQMGNYLSGVIVVTHDVDGLPVRALKTNKLGQFLAATPLPNGTYTLTFEKDNLNFDIVEIALDGKVLPAIKITAKGGIA